MKVAEYLKTRNGKSLSGKFNKYLRRAESMDGAWWKVNCLRYCNLKEVWTMFTECFDEDVENIREDFAEEKPGNLFSCVENWAAVSEDAPIVHTCNHGFDRWEQFNAAWNPLEG